MKILRGIIALPIWLLIAISSAIMLVCFKAIEKLYHEDAGTLFLRKALGDSHNWAVIVEEIKLRN